MFQFNPTLSTIIDMQKELFFLNNESKLKGDQN